MVWSAVKSCDMYVVSNLLGEANDRGDYGNADTAEQSRGSKLQKDIQGLMKNFSDAKKVTVKQ